MAIDVLLAPGATRPVGAGDRARPEIPDPYRLCFERDLDRIKHSRPWRRLAGKCQVFIAPEDDHLRTRLTHAVEVAQVATGIARAANLCLPLVEAIALAARLRARPRRPRLRGGVLAVPAGHRATTTPSTEPTSPSRGSTCVGRRSTASATIPGGAPPRPRPRERSWRGPIGSRTSATTSRTRCGRASSSRATSRSRCATSSVASDPSRSARSCSRCSTPSIAPATSP